MFNPDSTIREESVSSGPSINETGVSEEKLTTNAKATTNEEGDSSSGKRFKADIQQCNQNESRSYGKSNLEKTKNIKKKDSSTDHKQMFERINKQKKRQEETPAESELRKKVNRENMREKRRMEKPPLWSLVMNQPLHQFQAQY